MIVHGEEFSFKTEGYSDIHDLTDRVAGFVKASGVDSGIVHVFAVGSTASVTTIEFEPALVEDMREKLEEFAPRDRPTRHGRTWGDDNGFSHLRATMMGPGLTVPIHEGSLVLGQWQQIVVIDHDNRPRDRRVFLQAMGR
jgi:secondary thiamine-phosphate synthase enzyme